MLSISRRHVSRKFLSESDKDKIIKLYHERKSYCEIAIAVKSNVRQVKDFISRYNNNQTCVWTKEEEMILEQKRNLGITSARRIQTFLPRKTQYMIRNRLKILNKSGASGVMAPLIIEKTLIDFEETIEFPSVIEDDSIFRLESTPAIESTNGDDAFIQSDKVDTTTTNGDESPIHFDADTISYSPLLDTSDNDNVLPDF